MSKLLEEWIYEKIFQDLNKTVRHEFWEYFENLPIGHHGSVNVHDAFGYLCDIYRHRYSVALARLKWLQSMAILVPSSSRKPLQTAPVSAFTPVKGKSHVERGFGGRLQGPRTLRSPSNETSSTKATGPRRHSVTFEKGTKGEEYEEELEVANAEDEERSMVVDGMDGSYIPPNLADNSLFLDNSSIRDDGSAQPELNFSNADHSTGIVCPVVAVEKEEEDELFIRSPIGGSQVSSQAVVSNPQVARSLFSGQAVSNPPPSRSLATLDVTADSSLHNLKGLSQTSTPGLSLKQTQTPGPLTPIEHADPHHGHPHLSKMLSETTIDMDTPVARREDKEKDNSVFLSVTTPTAASSSALSLPDASQIFGESVPARPMPGANVTWPSNDSSRMSVGSSSSRLVTMIRAMLFSTFPQVFAESVKSFYQESFNTHKVSMDSSLFTDESSSDNQELFDEMNGQMDEMGLMELISGASVTQIVHSEIEKHISDQCKGNFDTSYLSGLEEWLDDLVLGWLTRIYASKKTQLQKARLKAFRDRLWHFVYQTYAKSLIGQLFDIIIDYPDSKPAILDLKTCLEKTNLRAELVSHLKGALESRLLHPGVNTADILTAYISAIKALRLLEPAGVILELVCEPVGRYLRSREDTVRCIVASLTDEGHNELISELVNTKPLEEEEQDDDGSMKHWEDWMPDPMDADPSIVSKSRRSADILSTLVNIYGSKELFVNEYRALLADRILMQYNYDEQRELRYLELLKLRFGEAHLHFCEVMLRDVTESRRVNARVVEAKSGVDKSPNDIEMNAMILSAQFWPAFRDEKITLPPELQVHLDNYTKQFESQKQNRTLVWKPHLGMMNIELELKEETLNFSVSPVQAAIIMKFQEGNTKWSVEELSSELEMTASVLRRKITFWQSQGLLKEVQPDVFQLVEDRKGAPHDMVLVDEEEVESAMASAQQQKEEEMQVFWTYIQSMLSNLNCLPLERIHSMLRIFAMGETSSTDITVQELKAFLDNKVKDQILVYSSGVYRLNK